MSLLKDLTAITTPALSDLVYCVQNDTDFKVTNAQLLALMKVNIVIPLTQAQYDNLTPAEKNNGSIYIITDGTITADDVEYSSGVSVADKIDDIDKKLHIESGYIGADASNPKRVTFSKPYTTAPNVVVTPYNTSSPRQYLRACTLTAITTTYFEFVEVAIQDNTGRSFVNGNDTCHWIAYGT